MNGTGLIFKDPGDLLKDPGLLLKGPGLLSKGPGGGRTIRILMVRSPGAQEPGIL